MADQSAPSGSSPRIAGPKASAADESIHLLDPVEMTRIMTRIAEQSQHLVAGFLSRHSAETPTCGMVDPLHIGQAFLDMTARIMANPAKLVEAQISLWSDYMSLWQSTTRKMLGEPSEAVVKAAPEDRRFKDVLWDENYVFNYIKQSYLLSARWMQSLARDVEGLDDKTARKVDFYTRQFVDAMAPSNFAMTNPEVLKRTIETGGENLLTGLSHLLEDLERGKGGLMIRMTDVDAFKLGENIAVSPGKVVFQNDLMQLIQYAPSTETVAKRPLLIVPPWINKFYILDLRPTNSFVKWAVDQGHTVFMISWVNPGEELANKSFDDYLVEGPLAALDAIEKATGEREVNAIGYCLGGTLLASTLAFMAARKDTRIASATFFATMIDFEEAGELSVFIDEEQLASLEERMNEKGYLEGRDMAMTFNMLRANDLIWSFVVNNYLLGKEPFPFDLLYWNSDSTRMPAAMHSFYLRQMYQENHLSAGEIKLLGVKIDLTRIKTPTFVMASREDHIAPWKSTYVATQTYKGPIEFVLAASGHIAGVVNAPAANKYCHWTNPATPKSADAWLAGAVQHGGSWWPHWDNWVKAHSGGEAPARRPGEGKLKAIENAPGAYVAVRGS